MIVWDSGGSVGSGADGSPIQWLPGALSAQLPAPAAQRNEAVLRSWQDRVKIDGRDQPRRIEIVFDYESGVTRRRVYDAQDRLISDEALAEQPRGRIAHRDYNPSAAD